MVNRFSTRLYDVAYATLVIEGTHPYTHPTYKGSELGEIKKLGGR